MVAYRRNFVPGGSYFFTVTLLDLSSSLLTDRIDDLREAMRSVRAERPFSLDAIVVLPDHLHCIWTLPPGDVDFSLSGGEGSGGKFSSRIVTFGALLLVTPLCGVTHPVALRATSDKVR